MKKLLIVSAVSILMLVGCSREESNTKRDSIFTVVERIGTYDYIVKDTNTGCYYIQSGSSGNVFTYSPYLDKDGQVMGCGIEDSKYKY